MINDTQVAAHMALVEEFARTSYEGQIPLRSLRAAVEASARQLAEQAAPGVVMVPDPLEKLTRISEKLGLYDDFATPPPAPVLLTEAEIVAIRKAQVGRYGAAGLIPYADSLQFARAIESKVLRRVGGGA